MATRHQVRQAIVSLLYANDMGTNSDKFLDEYLEEHKIRNDRKNQVLESFSEIISLKEQIDEILVSCLKDGDISKVGMVETCILRLGIYEMKYSDVDKAVIINEAIELAKELTSETSPKFINAVLDSVRGKC